MPDPRDLAALLAGGVPRVAVPFSDAVADAALREAAADGLDVAELRIDRFSSVDPEHVEAQIGRFAAFGTLATIRSPAEGGSWAAGDEERLALFERVIPLVDGVDVELSSSGIVAEVAARARAHGKLVVVSSHDFERTPPHDELSALASGARSVGADLVKVATTARSAGDLRTLARFTLAQAEAGVIVVAMGPYGPASRVLLPLLGSRLTYASVGEPVANGQMSLPETVALLRRLSPEHDDGS